MYWKFNFFKTVSDNGVDVGIFMPSTKVEKCFEVDKSICIMNAELIGIFEGIKLAVNDGNYDGR